MATPSIIDLLEQNAQQNSTTAWIPSLSKEIAFKSLNARNRQDIMQTMAATKYYPSAFAITTRDIIKDTILDKQVDINQFTAVDKLVAILAIRAFNIGDKISVVDTVDASDNEVECDKMISITDHLKLIRDLVDIESIVTPRTLESRGVSVTFAVPNLGREYKYELALYNKLLQLNNQADGPQPGLGPKMISLVFIFTLAQYLIELKVGDEVFRYDDNSVVDCVQVTQKLPQDILQQLSGITNEIAEKLQQLMQVSFAVDITQDDGSVLHDVPVTGNISMDADFFFAKEGQ